MALSSTTLSALSAESVETIELTASWSAAQRLGLRHRPLAAFALQTSIASPVSFLIRMS